MACVAPTLIEEPGSAKSIEAKRAELAAVGPESVLSAEEVEAIRAIGDNTGSMLLKGAAPDFEGEPQPDRWPIDAGLDRARRALGHRTRSRPGQGGLSLSRAGPITGGSMFRLHSIGAAAFALLTLALPTYALTHQPTKLTHFDTRGQLMDVNLAEVVTTAQAQGDGPTASRPRGAATRSTSDYTATRRPEAAVQGRLRVRRRPPEPLRRLA